MNKLKYVLNLHWIISGAPFVLALIVMAVVWRVWLGNAALPTVAVAAIVVFGYAYCVLGAYAMRQLLYEVLKEKWGLEPVKWAPKISFFGQAVLLLVASPAIIVYGALILVALAISLILIRAEVEYKTWSRLGRWLMSKSLNRPGLQWVRWLYIVAPVVTLAAGLLIEPTRGLTVIALVLTAGLVVVTLGVIASVRAVNKIDERRKIKSSKGRTRSRSGKQFVTPSSISRLAKP